MKTLPPSSIVTTCTSHPPPAPRLSSTPPLVNKRLQSLVHRLKVKSASQLSATQELTTQPESDTTSFLFPEEASSLTPDQQQFVIRKRKAALGLGPIMPESSTCQCCNGTGIVLCHQCGGTGVNAGDKAAELFSSDREIKQNNGLVNSQWYFMEEGPCWLCRSKTTLACSDCSGTGIRGGIDKYSGD